MAAIYEEKSRNSYRVFINKKDIESWDFLELDDEEKIKTWIKLGIKNENISERLNSIEDKLDRFIKMNAWYGHFNLVLNGLVPYEAAHCYPDKRVEKRQNNFDAILKHSNILCSSLFPDIKQEGSIRKVKEYLENLGIEVKDGESEDKPEEKLEVH